MLFRSRKENNMSALLEEIGEYWSHRPEGYSQVNEKEWEGGQHQSWQTVLTKEFPQKDKNQMKILDIGTGPGFFPMILAELDYRVTAVDYTPEMLCKAKENMERFIPEKKHMVTFYRMDAQRLEFADESFDVVLSRNLTWNLENPREAYREWIRVLKPGGVLLNFDANWYHYLYDEEKRAAFEQDRKNVEARKLDDHCTGDDIDEDKMEYIARRIPMSQTERPEWDIRILKELGLQKVKADEKIWSCVWSEEERLNYGSTPMFMMKGVKK